MNFDPEAGSLKNVNSERAVPLHLAIVESGFLPDIVNAITGHLRKTVADSYGEFPIDALFRKIAKIPAFDVT
jgi:hypothetical protein